MCNWWSNLSSQVCNFETSAELLIITFFLQRCLTLSLPYFSKEILLPLQHCRGRRWNSVLLAQNWTGQLKSDVRIKKKNWKKKKKLKVKDLANIYLKKRGASDSYPGRWGDDTWPSSGAWWCGSAMASLHSPICLLPPLDRTACSQRPACDWVRDAMSRSVCSAWLWLSAHSGQRSLKNVKKQKWHDRNVHMMILTLTPAVL